jgi:DNA polymerase I-like protein with 3'-5' exonuclease and polymerase domains
MTKVAGIYFFRWILENNYFNIVKMVQVTHDEYGIECPKEMGEICRAKLQECMEKAGKVFCKTIPIVAEATIEEYWNH